MSETNSYKNVTLTGEQAFAVSRALRCRIDSMQALHVEAVAQERGDLAGYALQQERDARSALVVVNGAVLFVPMSDGMRP